MPTPTGRSVQHRSDVRMQICRELKDRCGVIDQVAIAREFRRGTFRKFAAVEKIVPHIFDDAKQLLLGRSTVDQFARFFAMPSSISSHVIDAKFIFSSVHSAPARRSTADGDSDFVQSQGVKTL
jgi:hypothetical protein